MDPTAILKVENLSHSFGTSPLAKQVLHEVSVTFRAGEIVIIMGPSGSGKTTFLSLAGALRSPQAGSILFNNKDISKLSAEELVIARRDIGFIFQSHNLISSITACQNVQLPLGIDPNQSAQTSLTRALELLDMVGLREHANKTPRQLSGGQCQRVAIARALARNPQLILADEPTASLDRDTGREVVEILHQLARKLHSTILIVTHDHRILDIADRILLLEDGRMQDLETRLDSLLTGFGQLFRIISEDLSGPPQTDSLQDFESQTLKLEHSLNSVAHLKAGPSATRRIELLQQMLGSARLVGGSAREFAKLSRLAPANLNQLANSFVQALDALILTAQAAFQDRDDAEISLLYSMTGDRKEVMARLREKYFAVQQGLAEEQKVYLFDLSNTFTRLVYLLNSIADNLKKWNT